METETKEAVARETDRVESRVEGSKEGVDGDLSSVVAEEMRRVTIV